MAHDSKGIRSYGPGKFSTILDSYVWGVSLDGGTDDEIGEADTTGWYGLMRHGHTIFKNHDPLLEELNEDEADFLVSCAGCIVSEDSQGFVNIDYYTTAEELDRAWDEILTALETNEDEEEL